MILDSIVLENFGAYGGRQEAILTPEEGKPIILFGGMNGGGKTTLLDAVQLAFYGPKARLSNRNRMSYRDYLRECINRNCDPSEGAGITIRFRRMMESKSRQFELQRTWRQGIKGIEEHIRVWCDGKLDDIFTDHWDETIEAYLPSGISHLFFFDGEQVEELAEGGHAAQILGTAVYSLLGLDLVDRLETDLKAFERRKKSEGLNKETLNKLNQVKEELKHIDEAEANAYAQEAKLNGDADRLAKNLRQKEDQFRAEGGDLYLRRKELEADLIRLYSDKRANEMKLRELAAGALPLLMVESLLTETEQQARHESEIKRARTLIDSIQVRDQEVVTSLRGVGIDTAIINKLETILESDRKKRVGLAKEMIFLDADEGLVPHISHLHDLILPQAEEQSREFIAIINRLEEKIARLECEIERIPTEDHIANIQSELEQAKRIHEAKLSELETVKIHLQALKKHREAIEDKLDRLTNQNIDLKFAEDDRQRMLNHSSKVRNTLEKFRTQVVRRHIVNMESLILESFCKLLRKSDLVAAIQINTQTFEPTLKKRDGKDLPIERLSAGERQLLATSMLWGLARASGRPVPTIIDTPLGRLDSSHRKHLVERYFPNASHQVLLLSTDEEIVGPYYDAIKQQTTRSYLLAHDEQSGQTKIQPGYFNK